MFYQLRSLFDIFNDGTRLYYKHWGRLTYPLVYPVLAQFMGIMLWLGLTYGFVDWMTDTFPASPLWLLWTGFILANIPGMFLFFDGFWRYLIWVSAMNLMIRELVETGQCDELHPYYIRVHHRAVDYTLVWTFLFGLVFIPVGLGMLPLSIFSGQPEGLWMGMIASTAITGVGLLIGLILMLFFALVFQVFAFTPGSAGASLFRSLDLVAQGIWKSLVVVAIALIATQFVLPAGLTDLCDAAGLTPLLGQPVEAALHYLVREYGPSVQTFNDPFLQGIFTRIAADSTGIATDVMRALIFIVISAMLLPLGTCWFALLYADLKTRLDRSRSVEKAPEKMEATV